VVTLTELDSVMQQASQLAGAGSARVRAELVLGLVGRLTAQERVFVLGLLRGGLRQGALESVVLTAVADAGVSLSRMSVVPWLPRGICPASRRPFFWRGRGARSLSADGRPGRRPDAGQLGQERGSGSGQDGTGRGRVEARRIRAQIHKQDNDIRVLTRSLDDITDRVPEVVELIATWPVTSGIFDGELIALRPDGRPRPFQETGSRTASRVDPMVARERLPCRCTSLTSCT